MTSYAVPVLLDGSVRLEPLSSAHVPGLAAAAQQRSTFALTQVPDGLAETADYVRSALADQAAGRCVPFAVCSADVVVGTTRFGDLAWFTRSDGPPEAVEIGWTWYAEAVQRTGVNTAVKRMLLCFAFEDWHVVRVVLKTDARNARSRAAISRIGARYEGTRRAHMPAADGGIRDTAYYSVIAAEWPEVKALLDRLAAR